MGRCSGVYGDADQRDQQRPPRHDRSGSCNRPSALLDEAFSDLMISADPMFFSSWTYRCPLALIGLGRDMSHEELIQVFVVDLVSLRFTPEFARHFTFHVSVTPFVQS